MPQLFVDSHCHLNLLPDFKKTSDATAPIAEAAEQGVSHILCVSVDMESLPDVLKISRQFDNVFSSVGVHPNVSSGEDPSVETLCKWANTSKVVAIGETGLDYFRSPPDDAAWQQSRFRRHIAAAKQCNKPLIIHCRDAREDTLRILQEEGAAEVGGVMHCFVEDRETAQAAMEMNFYISFSGIVTFKSAKELHEVAKQVPLDRILIETDAPYLAPAPFRGRVNQPAYVRYVAEYIAQLRGVSVDEIAEATTRNFFERFHIR